MRVLLSVAFSTAAATPPVAQKPSKKRSKNSQADVDLTGLGDGSSDETDWPDFADTEDMIVPNAPQESALVC